MQRGFGLIAAAAPTLRARNRRDDLLLRAGGGAGAAARLWCRCCHGEGTTTTCDAMPVVEGRPRGFEENKHKRLERGREQEPAVETKSD